jgi:hypothetical protein
MNIFVGRFCVRTSRKRAAVTSLAAGPPLWNGSAAAGAVPAVRGWVGS